MHPVPTHDHPGVRDTPGEAANGLINALFLAIVAIVDLIASLVYGFSQHP